MNGCAWISDRKLLRRVVQFWNDLLRDFNLCSVACRQRTEYISNRGSPEKPPRIGISAEGERREGRQPIRLATSYRSCEEPGAICTTWRPASYRTHLSCWVSLLTRFVSEEQCYNTCPPWTPISASLEPITTVLLVLLQQPQLSHSVRQLAKKTKQQTIV